ncbi:MAG TPA: esterase-like activity of phytase family protein [Polyangia bacterium]|jgi:hypothetical protein|nr:esterase-like activity of phytase family protein [Polyangia bacterium]
MKTYRWSYCAVGVIGLALNGCGQDGSAADDEDQFVQSSGGALTVVADDPVVVATEDVTVTVPERFNETYSGMAQSEFPDGLPLSVGSGLRFNRRGRFFYGLGDRGPNGDSPDYLDGGHVSHPAKSFVAPDYAPKIITIAACGAGPIVTSAVAIKAGGVNVTGLPPATLTSETALSETLAAFPPSTTGIDPEGIDIDAAGNLWVGEEYGPSLLKINPRNGEILTKLIPGAGLPAILASRQVNRGFEGVAVAPNGKVYGLVQSTLDINGNSKGKAQFIRLVEYDPATGATKMYAYPHTVSAYGKSGDAKLGDLLAVDNHRFVTIEEGKDKNKAFRNVVYGFDIRGATDLTGLTLTSGPNAGKDLEYGTAEELAAQITMVSKSQILDLRAYGWTDEKAEGLSLTDMRTLVVANDQDFGVSSTMTGDPTSTDPTAYVVDAAGALTIKGVPSPGHYEIHAAPAAAQRSHFFTVHLREPIVRYCPQPVGPS